MSTVTTAHDIGVAIRRRRKELGWDQARLAQAAGTSRQWIVDIERGKPRAELELVLRTLTALDLSLAIRTRQMPPPSVTATRTFDPRPPIDINAIVERASRPPAWLAESKAAAKSR